MTDFPTVEKQSEAMSLIRPKGTKQEAKVFCFLRKKTIFKIRTLLSQELT